MRLRRRFYQDCLMHPSVGHPTFREALVFALGDTINLWAITPSHPISRCESASQGLAGDMARIGIDLERVIEREKKHFGDIEGEHEYGKEAAE